jgi:hypothetical protein
MPHRLNTRRQRAAAVLVALAVLRCGGGGPKEGPELASHVHKKGRLLSVTVLGATGIRVGDSIDLLGLLRDEATHEPMSMTLLQNVKVLDALPAQAPGPDGEVRRSIAIEVLPEEVEVVVLASQTGVLFASLRNPEDLGVQEERGRATMQTLLTGERINTLLKKRTTTIQVIKGTSEPGGYGSGPSEGKMGRKEMSFDAPTARPSAAPEPEPEMPKPVETKPSPKKKPSTKGDLATTEDAEKSEGGEGSAPAAATRAWFPESFLFAPLVVTDLAGQAALNVPVPDRLTTWRILALAHSEGGAQAGDVTRFLGTLPAYVDPVLPAFLAVGDQVKLPIQVVNTTADALAQTLHLEAENATLTGGGPLKVAGHDSAVTYAQLQVDHPGAATVKATLGSTDAVARTVPVRSLGKPTRVSVGGTLAAPRDVAVEAPADLQPETTQVRLQVFPGALALLRSELSVSLDRGSPADDGYALLLAGRAPALLQALGDTPNVEVLRRARLVAGQRVIRDARATDTATSTLLAQAALAHPGDPVLSRLGQRLALQIARSQRPDGTFEGGNGWTLQRLLVATADAIRAVRADAHDDAAKQRAQAATLKASGAFERHLSHIQDGYTAAAVLSSGAVTGAAAEKLRALVRDAVVADASGARSLPVAAQVVRADGRAPTLLESTARAALALSGDAKATWRADLGSTLLSAYSPSEGWGDGVTNLVALEAVLDLFKTPLPPSVKVTLSQDGQVLATGELSGAALKDVLTLEARPATAAGAHRYQVTAEPPVPGLGFSLGVSGDVPWKAEPPSGIELALKLPAKLAVGVPADVEVSAAGPAGLAMKVHQALPAGVQPDVASLEKLVSDGAIVRYRVESGGIELELEPLSSGQAFNGTYRVVPTLAGTLHASASSIEVTERPGQAHHLPPSVWKVE